MRAFRAFIAASVAAPGLLCGCEPVDVTVKPTPIRVVSETAGIGRPAHAGDLVTINYRAMLPDGRQLIRSDAYRFELGTGAVIRGIDEAVEGMRAHGRRTVECPPNKHWGRAGYGDGTIPPNTMLTIHIELAAID